jgi:hypothetical protein
MVIVLVKTAFEVIFVAVIWIALLPIFCRKFATCADIRKKEGVFKVFLFGYLSEIDFKYSILQNE